MLLEICSTFLLIIENQQKLVKTLQIYKFIKSAVKLRGLFLKKTLIVILRSKITGVD